MADVTRAPLGAILAGGGATRFGGPKGLARVGGERIVDRVAAALGAAVPATVLIANDPAIQVAGLARIPDTVPGAGPLGGILTALDEAARLGRPGALCVAWDMPLVTAALLGAIVELAAAHPGRIVVPESGGPRDIEPLCACYPVAARDAFRAAIAAGELAPHRLLEALPPVLLPAAELRALGDPATLFLNVNTPEELRRAQRIAT